MTNIIKRFLNGLGEKLFAVITIYLHDAGYILGSGPMRSTDFRAVVEPIMNEVFDGVYDQRADEWKTFVDQRTGTPRAYHEEPVLYGFGAAPEIPDGQPITYQQGGQLFTKRYVYKVYGLAFALTKVLRDDGDAVRIGTVYSRHLAQSMVETKETLCANIPNRSFNAAYIGGDGVSLINASHPIIGGSFSNILAIPAALSQTSVEQLLIQVRNAVDNNGKKIRLTALKLAVPPALQFQAEVIIKSVLRTGTANNDINPVVSMGMLPQGATVVSRLTSTTAWWIKTDAPEGIKLMMRTPLSKGTEGDFETDSVRYKSTERYEVGWTDPRSAYGTQGL